MLRKPGDLRHVSHLGAVVPAPRDGLVIDRDLAAVRVRESENAFEQGGLSRRVGAEDRGDRAAMDVERHIVEHAKVSEGFGEMANLDHLELLLISGAPAGVAPRTAIAVMRGFLSTSASGVNTGITRSVMSMM